MTNIDQANELRARVIEIDQQLQQLNAIPLMARPLDKIEALSREAVALEMQIIELRADLYP
ncbi:hypothetical protein [Marinobacterium lutimaris]|uniref:Uncharacterized protein n=1 Tax=Marinobacterium lutimaris TaxID=568106 RepID=A0A1H5XTW9_9GAMM|nr:hypothetical protein [Marinobacterium lutimaris]SEG15171.1 hypothetical protein SAMN05444390_1011503 [Marinobacterium lutimaris]